MKRYELTVGKLIEELQNFPADLPVVIQGDSTMFDKEVGVLCIVGTPWTWPDPYECGTLYRVTEIQENGMDAVYICNFQEQLAKIRVMRTEGAL